MQSIGFLMSQLEKNLVAAPDESRGPMLCSIAAAMAGGCVGLNSEQMTQFDDLLCRFSTGIDADSLSKLGFVFAHLESGPAQLVGRLSSHDDILVAGSVLAGSPLVGEAQLMDVVGSRPKPFLRAVCEREKLSEPLTDAILKRGDIQAMRLAAKNPGARFTEGGFAILIEQAAKDEPLALHLAGRSDVPPQVLSSLLGSVGEEMRKKLVHARPGAAAAMRGPAKSANESDAADSAETEKRAKAREKVTALYREGDLDNDAVLAFAELREVDETLIAMALLCRIDVDAAYRALNESGTDTVLLMAKLCDLQWPTVKSVLGALKGGVSPAEIDKAKSHFLRMNQATARQVLQLRTRPKTRGLPPAMLAAG